MKKIVLLILVFAGGISWLIYRESRFVLASEVSAWKADHTADCAVVLTGGASRVREGFDLLSQERVKKLIISGVNPKATLREIFPQWPFYGDLDERDVILEKRSRTTWGNAQQSLVLVEALHCTDVILVTSHLHMYRARKSFEAIYPKDFPIQFRGIVAGDYRPTPSGLLIESLKSLFYRLWAY